MMNLVRRLGRRRRRARRLAARWLGALVDDGAAFVFPESCLACGRGDLDRLPTLGRVPSRLQNGRLRHRIVGPWSVPLRLLCGSCCAALSASPPADCTAVDVAAFTPSPILFRLLHALKYEGLVELVPWFGARLARAAQRMIHKPNSVLVPIPLHPQRHAERGFNHSALLAHDVGARLGVPVWDGLLERRKPTRPLARMAHAERRAEVRNAFVRRAAVADLRVVLVDDVVTTGATRDAVRAVLEAPRPLESASLALCRARDAPTWGATVTL